MVRTWPLKALSHLVPITPGRMSLAQKDYILALRRAGCTNRPFYQMVVTKTTYPLRKYIRPHEQVGTYDPLVNSNGEKLCALNMERLLYYLSQGIRLDLQVAQLLGLAGILPQHPTIYRTAWRNRRELRRGIPLNPTKPKSLP